MKTYIAGTNTEIQNPDLSKDATRAKPWVDPYGTSGMYMTGECYRAKDGTVYRCL